MHISYKHGYTFEHPAELTIVPVFEGKLFAGAYGKLLSVHFPGLVTRAERVKFTGKLGQTLAVSHPHHEASTLILIGAGEEKRFDANTVRELAGHVVHASEKAGAHHAVFPVASQFLKKLKAEFSISFSTGAQLANYTFNAYKKREGRHLEEITVLVEDKSLASKLEKQSINANPVIAGISLARDLVNTPAKDMTPTVLADHAKSLAKLASEITVSVHDKTWAEKQGMGAYLAVSQGSDEPPKFIHLVYKPKRAKKKIGVVGKGVTFDSGGLSLKPGQGMETMKCDMAGSATVLGLFRILAETKPNVEVHGYIAATENMPSGKAIRPGDIVKSANGKTIEILNTDAEGRLTLADALWYAQKESPDFLIDLATLTGACVVALGEEIAGLMGNTPSFNKALLASAKTAGEKLWELPLEKRYKDLMKSHIADLKNISKIPYGGTLTAGLFIEEFINEGQAWAHLDIAGPAFAEKPLASYIGLGGTGYGITTLLDFIQTLK